MSTTPAISGEQLTLRSGGYRAHIASVGASLRTLTFEGRDLVLPFRADELRPTFRGTVLAPWPNRVVDGRWRWRGEDLQLALTEPDRGHALHGLVAWLDWRATSVTASSVVLETAMSKRPTGAAFTRISSHPTGRSTSGSCTCRPGPRC